MVATPNYSLALAGGPAPITAGIQGALSGYQQAQQMRAREQQMQLAKQQAQQQAQLAPVQLQMAQEKAQMYPKLAAQQVEASRMKSISDKIANTELGQKYIQNKLADIGYLPPEQQEQQYKSVLGDASNLGINVGRMPPQYDNAAKNAVNIAVMRSPQVAQERQFENQVALQHLKGQQAIEAAKAKATIKAAPEQPFAKAEATQMSGMLKGVNAEAQSAKEDTLPLYNKLMDQLQKVPTNPVSGHLLWTNPEGQRFNQLLTRAQGEIIKNFHLGRMTQYEFNIIRQSLGKGTTYKSALQKSFQDQMDRANQSIHKQNFALDYIKRGGQSPTEFTSMWINRGAQPSQAGAPQQIAPPGIQQQQTAPIAPSAVNAQPAPQVAPQATTPAVPTQSDLEYTAKIHGLTVDQVKQRLGIK